MTVNDKFGESWANELGEYFKTESFKYLVKQINNERNTKEVFPSPDKTFRVFKMLSPKNIKVVSLAQDPFPNNQASGVAFDNSLASKMSPSLRIINQELQKEYPDRFCLDPQDLTPWVNQGVFLYNTALTVVKSSPGSHIDIWKPFTEEVMKILSKQEFIVWLLLGKEAQKYAKYAGINHVIIQTPHPASEIYSGGNGGFLGSDCFKKVNEVLDKNNILKIKW